MEERRKTKRTEMVEKLSIKRLDSEDIGEADIEITDVSQSGVGFNCRELLSIGAVYEAYLTIWTKEVLHTFLQVVRIELLGNAYSYGSVFIGMPETDITRIQVYQTVSGEI